jgi:hypothetical protein
LHATALLTAWAPRRHRSRVRLKSTGRQVQDGFQHRRRSRAPCPENTFFMLRQAVITMSLGVLQQHSPELLKRLYDLVRQVVR